MKPDPNHPTRSIVPDACRDHGRPGAHDRRLHSAWRQLVLAISGLVLSAAASAQEANGLAPQRTDRLPDGSQLFQRVAPSVLKITVVKVGSTDAPEGHGTAFVVDSAEGLAMTNLHVAFHVLDGKGRVLDAQSNGRSMGRVDVVAVDVINDLALVRGPGLRGLPALRLRADESFDPGAKGVAAYAIGEPMAMGMSIVPGYLNGRIAGFGPSRLYFAGSLNRGMSGGPTVDARGQVVGVNVARHLSGEQLSLLVPASDARALMERWRRTAAGKANVATLAGKAALWAEVRVQLIAFHTRLLEAHVLSDLPWDRAAEAPIPTALSGLDCRHRHEDPKPGETSRPAFESFCRTPESMALGRARVGTIEVSRVFALARPHDTAWTFANSISARAVGDIAASPGPLMGRQVCVDREVRHDGHASGVWRVAWCVQPYRDMPGLYDLAIAANSRDDMRRAVVRRLTVEGCDWEQAQRYTARFLGPLWAALPGANVAPAAKEIQP